MAGAGGPPQVQGVSPGGFAGAGEQLADALQQRQQWRVGGKAHDQALFGEAAEVFPYDDDVDDNNNNNNDSKDTRRPL